MPEWQEPEEKSKKERQDTDPTHRVFTRQTTSHPIEAQQARQRGAARSRRRAPTQQELRQGRPPNWQGTAGR